MTEEVDLFDRLKAEPRDKWHPDYESFTDWLNAEAPANQAQKLRNRSKYRGKTQRNRQPEAGAPHER